MKRIIIDKNKLNNNNDLKDRLKEIEMYSALTYEQFCKEHLEMLYDDISVADNYKIFNHRKNVYSNHTYKVLNKDYSIISLPNYFSHSKKSSNDYVVEIYYKGCSIGNYSKNSNILSIDSKLNNSNFIPLSIINKLKKEVKANLIIKYEIIYVDWNNRPFIVTN